MADYFLLEIYLFGEVVRKAWRVDSTTVKVCLFVALKLYR